MNGIEKDLEGRAKVFRLNLLSAIGKEIASQYNVTAVPTTMAFDMDGKLVYQHAGVPSRKAVVDRLKS